MAIDKEKLRQIKEEHSNGSDTKDVDRFFEFTKKLNALVEEDTISEIVSESLEAAANDGEDSSIISIFLVKEVNTSKDSEVVVRVKDVAHGVMFANFTIDTKYSSVRQVIKLIIEKLEPALENLKVSPKILTENTTDNPTDENCAKIMISF